MATVKPHTITGPLDCCRNCLYDPVSHGTHFFKSKPKKKRSVALVHLTTIHIYNVCMVEPRNANVASGQDKQKFIAQENVNFECSFIFLDFLDSNPLLIQ